MIYYAKDNSVYSCEILLSDSDFLRISEKEYLLRLNRAVLCREEGFPATDEDEM